MPRPALPASLSKPIRLGAVVALAAASVALAQPTTLSDDTEPLDIQTLYQDRFRFDGRGRPVIAVGLMDGQTEVVLRGSSGTRVRYRDKRGERALQLPAGKKLVVRVKDGVPARIRRWAVVETLERDERMRREEASARWTARNVGETRMFDVGGIYGVEGTVVDNRATLVAIAPAREAQLDDLMRRVYKDTGIRCRVHEELVDVPRARLVFSDELGTPLGSGLDLIEVNAVEGGQVLVDRVETAPGYKNHGFENRAYADRMFVVVDSKAKLAVVNALEVDRMLAGIVPSEIFPSSPIEALKAQAITARGEVFAKVGLRHLVDPYVLCDEQHCQVYSGVASERPNCTAAVEATRGEMAFLGGRLVDSVYSSMCGGRSEDNEVVWEVPPAAALRGRVDWEGASALLASRAEPLEHGGHALPPPPLAPDPSRALAHPGLLEAADLSGEAALRRFLEDPPPAFCAHASLGKKDKFRWTRRLTREEVNDRTRELGVGEVVGLEVRGRGKSGRLRTLEVVGKNGSAFVHRELPVRRLFGNLPSGLFVIDEERLDAGGPVVAFVFRGAGHGHGVGMCQTGAVGMAEMGHDYRDILRHYYNGAEVRRVY